MCGPRDINDTSWVPFFVCQREVWALCHLVSVILGVLSLPCAFLPFAPPVVHSCHCCVMLTIGIHNPPRKQWLAAVVLGAGILFLHQMGRGRGLTWWGILLLGSPGILFCYPHIPAVSCCGWDENFWSTNKVPITCQACTCCVTC